MDRADILGALFLRPNVGARAPDRPPDLDGLLGRTSLGLVRL